MVVVLKKNNIIARFCEVVIIGYTEGWNFRKEWTQSGGGRCGSMSDQIEAISQE